ncbi:MAG: 50S ribosomal protein L24 [Verrucomicrobia bacterium]|nr:50S ribosomal protein L24 [Verrucomicrobiota bacterium]NBU68217.1 50S ribosomal protein L24 [Verrucomicrobiota bacterium]NDB99811.1 50S ribosomal protein L24 [Verrucomicrobiota bacterium]NDF16351.1 50S ribosomal protein L24 [Verrucomicrobiota bacterium]
MTKFHVRKGDEVEVITGANRGRKGKVLEIKTDSHRVLIEGVNMIKRHVRPTQDNPKGGVVEREGALHVSNVRLVNRPAAGKRDGKKAKDKPAKGKK